MARSLGRYSMKGAGNPPLVKDYIVLYIILVTMSYILSLKFAKKLFKESAVKTYYEEV